MRFRFSPSIIKEPELVAALKLNDEKAFAYLYDHYCRSLNGYIKKMIEDDELSNDILQETFINIWRKIGSYNPDKGRLFTWMLRIANNITIDTFRSKSYRNNQKNDSISCIINISPIVQDLFNPDIIGIDKIIGLLRPNQRILIELVYFKGYTHEEIAKLLKMPVGTVKTRSRNGLILLRKYYSGDKIKLKSAG